MRGLAGSCAAKVRHLFGLCKNFEKIGDRSLPARTVSPLMPINCPINRRVKETKSQRDEESKRRRDEETKRGRVKETKRRRDEETKRKRGKEEKRKRKTKKTP